MNPLERRIERLEQATQPAEQADLPGFLRRPRGWPAGLWTEETDEQFAAAMIGLALTMPEELVERLAAGWEAGLLSRGQGRLLRTMQALACSWAHGRPYARLALPGPVCDALLRDPEPMLFYDCEDCCLMIPHRDGVNLLPTCPLCGGRTGPFAYAARCSREREQVEEAS